MGDSWSNLFNAEPGPADALAYALGLLFAVALAAGLYARLRATALFGRNLPLVRLARVAGTTAAVIGGLGLLFAIAAVAAVPLLSARFWLAALAVVGLVLLGLLVYQVRVRAPRHVRDYEQRLLRQRYMPIPSAKKKSKGRRR